jgi:hypothetical protein
MRNKTAKILLKGFTKMHLTGFIFDFKPQDNHSFSHILSRNVADIDLTGKPFLEPFLCNRIT